MMYYIYILHSKSSNIYYIGYSEDPWKRVLQHNEKEEGTFSAKHKPWELAVTFEIGDKSEAISIERFLKKQKTKILIERLIDPLFIPNGKLSKLVRVPHLRDPAANI